MERDITGEVKRVIQTQLDVADARIKPEASLIEDLGAQPLGLVGLARALEKAFVVDIADEDLVRIRTVQDAIDCIAARLRRAQ